MVNLMLILLNGHAETLVGLISLSSNKAAFIGKQQSKLNIKQVSFFPVELCDLSTELCVNIGPSSSHVSKHGFECLIEPFHSSITLG